MRLRRSLAGAVALALGVAAGANALAQARPKLVVLIVVDGLPQRQVTGYRDQLAADGLARFLERGAWFAEAHHGHAYTVTGAGHATLVTGASPHRHGIIGNEWRDLRTGEMISSGSDPSARWIGHASRPQDGTSPRNLKVETLGDVLKRADPRAKVVGIGGKDRGAIPLAGKDGTAYMFMTASGQFASSTFYMQRHPAWVDAFNAARPADRWFKAEWKPLLPEAAYARSIADDQPWYPTRGSKLPMLVGGAAEAPGPAFYDALMPSPFSDAVTLEFARAALAGEQLGRDDAPDFLGISLSGHDHANHLWSAESRLSHDRLLQLDRLLQDFLRDLDASVGRDDYIAVLASDHGFMPPPELNPTGAGGRINGARFVARVNGVLEQVFGVARLVAGNSASALVLDRRLLAERGLELDAVATAARAAVAALPGVAAAYTRRELESGSRSGAPWFEAMRRSWHPKLSGDVQYALQPYWMFGNATATHGSPHPYDTHVPIMLWGPRWVNAGSVATRVEATDLAPTLARLLGIPAPAASEGRVLPLP